MTTQVPGDDLVPLSVADRYYDAFNARDHGAWLDTLDEDVEILVDAGVLRGRKAALVYLNGILRAYPGVTVGLRRVVAVSPDAVVSEFKLLNPMSKFAAEPSDAPDSAAPWLLDGMTCEVLRLRADRLVSLHSYYSPTANDRTSTAEVPSRAEAARIANRQAALSQVATQVAGGASERDLVEVINNVIAEFAGVDVSLMMRFDTGDTAVLLAASGLADELAVLGQRFPLSAELRQVRDSGQARRFAARSWPLPEAVGPRVGQDELKWCVGVPILLKGRVWGVSLLGSAHDEPLADDIEEGITAFTQLVSTALANAQANDELRERAREQSELLEVAEIAAAGADEPRVYAAIVQAASAALEGLPTMLIRFVDDGAAEVLAPLGENADISPVGRRIHVDDTSVTAQVQRTGRPARIDDYREPPGKEGALRVGLRGSVGVPMTVGGRPWGVLAASSSHGPLPSTTEHRLSLFAGTGAAAIAGAQARGELLDLAKNQAALRRVAELAAGDAPVHEVLHVIAQEASDLAEVEFGMVLRFDDSDGGNQIVALAGAPDGFVEGMRTSGSGDSAVQRVWRTGHPARVEDLGLLDGLWPQMAHAQGFTTSLGVPVVIRGGLWGAVIVVGGPTGFSQLMEEHLSRFAELGATAVSAADAREELRLMADEHAAVRRVAELVARGAALEEVFRAVAVETSALLGGVPSSLLRYDETDAAYVVAASNPQTALTGRVFAASDDNRVLEDVHRKGQLVRIDAVNAQADSPNDVDEKVRLAVPVTVEEHIWGALAVRSRGAALPTGSKERLVPFAELAAVAIVNAETKAKLTASRARVVATADETQRRLERDVHDGAQQRLVHTVIALKMAKDALQAGESPVDLLNDALTHAERASRELRDIVRGILPASLTRGGLRTGLESLVADLALPVQLQVTAPRLSTQIETTAYFIVAEAITNVIKHAQASRATVTVSVQNRTLVIDVSDNGIGGADIRNGTGLTGLLDRVEAGNGTLTLTSQPGGGTTVAAKLPLDNQPLNGPVADAAQRLDGRLSPTV